MNIKTSIFFPKVETDTQNYYFFNDGFNDEELARIYAGVANIPFINAGVGESSEAAKEIRISKIKWVPKTQEWEWLYIKLMNMIIEANSKLWQFDLHTMTDDIQYTEYYASEGGHYNWHQDIGPGSLSTRKVSITVQLAGPDEYTGGDLEYWRGGTLDNVERAPKGKGVVFIFPSYMMHRVTKVETGVRRSFVLWVGGEHYK